MAERTAEYLPSGVQVVQAIPGRVRLRVTGSDRLITLSEIERSLQGEKGIFEVKTNENTGSVAILFDASDLPLSDFLEFLERSGVDVAQPSESSNQPDPFAAWKSTAFWKKQGRSFLPIIVGLLVARGLGLFGWRSLLAYIIAANTTRQLIDLVDSEQPIPLPSSTPETLLIRQKADSRGLVAQDNRPDSILSKDSPIAEQTLHSTHSAIAYNIVHAIPGRVRFHIPLIADDPQYARRLEKLTQLTFGVTSVRINPTAASIVINYDISAISPGQLRVRVSELIQEASEDKPATSEKKNPPPPPPAPPAESDADGVAPIAETALETAAIETSLASEAPPLQSAISANEETEETAVLQYDIEKLKAIAPALENDIETPEASEIEPVVKLVVLEIESEILRGLQMAREHPDRVEEQSVEQAFLTDTRSQKAAEEEDTATTPSAQITEEISESPLALQSAAIKANIDADEIAQTVPSEAETAEEEPVNLWHCFWQTVRSTLRSLRAGQPPMNALISGLRDAGAIS